MTPVGFEPTISTGEQLQTYALDRAATGTGKPGIRLFVTPRSLAIGGFIPAVDMIHNYVKREGVIITINIYCLRLGE